MKLAIEAALALPMTIVIAGVITVCCFAFFRFVSWSIHKRSSCGLLTSFVCSIFIFIFASGYVASKNLDRYITEEERIQRIALDEDPGWRNRALRRGEEALELPGQNSTNTGQLTLESKAAATVYAREVAGELRGEVQSLAEDLSSFSPQSDQDVALQAVEQDNTFSTLTEPIEIRQSNSLADAVLDIRLSEFFDEYRAAAGAVSPRLRSNCLLLILLTVAIGGSIVGISAWKKLTSMN